MTSLDSADHTVTASLSDTIICGGRETKQVIMIMIIIMIMITHHINFTKLFLSSGI